MSFVARKLFSLVILCSFVTTFSGYAESANHDQKNTWFTCKHTKREVERTKGCPCGCDKKKRSSLKIVADSHSCDSDDVVAHIPQFTSFSGYFDVAVMPPLQIIATGITCHLDLLATTTLEPACPPG